MVKAPLGLARKSVGVGSLWVFAVGASSPMTVVAGGIIATYATTGIVGVPLSFLVLGVAVALLTVGYVAMARHVPHAATVYALLSHGLGRPVGVAGAAVAVVSYTAMGCSLFGLLGVTMAGLVGGTWWVWAGIAWAVVGALGVAHVHLSARVLAVTLIAELVVLGVLDVVAFTHPAGGTISLAPLSTKDLFVNGVGGVFALGIAAFVGYESGPVFAEEAKTSRTVARATFATLVFLAVFYAVSAWALPVAVGTTNVVDQARDTSAGLPFSILADRFGPGMVEVATLLLASSIFAAMLSFHNTVARYLFALGRERVVPEALARIGTSGRRTGAPIGGSLVQSAISATVLGLFVLAHADPFTTLFTWLSTVGAVGVLTLLVGCSWAALRFFRHGGGTAETWWVRAGAPTLGIGCGAAILVTTVVNLGSLLGVPAGSAPTVVIPAVVAVAAVAGVIWGLRIRRQRPDVYGDIGRGRPHPLAVLDARLAELDV
jgi:amino acid transporter